MKRPHGCRRSSRLISGRLRVPAMAEELEPRSLLSLLGQQLFPDDNPWNQKIATAPVAANSAAIMASIIGRSGDGRFHPDFGQDTHGNNPLYGIPFNVIHGNASPRVHVVIDDYADESDVIDAPIPSNAVLEGDNQDGPVVGLDNRGDSHLIVFDVDNNVAYEFYNASRPSENGDNHWHAAQESVWDLKSNSFRTLGWTSADAAGLPILPGLVRPDEALPVSQGGQGAIHHAIRITLQNAIILDQFLYPASHVANPGNANPAVQPPMGARLRLKASVDLSHLDPQSKIIAQAMKDYGVIVADNGSNFFASGASQSVDASNGATLTWDDDDIQDTIHGLKSLHFSDFEVVELTPIVTGLGASAGSAGSTITVAGANFGGAAGHLQVFFGSTLATSVQILDDAHLSVVVPPGAGSVDVRVRSGVVAAEPDNFNDPIFGYGISARTTAAWFTYGAPGANQPTTLARPASASPGRVAGTSVMLSALGADDGGESSLTYTWQVLASPAGSHPGFRVNGTHAASQTTVDFDRAGDYVFRVTIADAAGLSITSDVGVSVSPTLSTIVVSPPSATLANRARQPFYAQALDQFAQPLAVQPRFTWSKKGPGTLNRAGLYTAPASGRGTVFIEASAGGKSDRALVQLVPARGRPRTTRRA